MLNRISGLFFTIFGLLLFFWITPSYTETVDMGWLRPATLPNILSIIMIIAGLVQTLFPTGKTNLASIMTLRFTLMFVLCMVALFLMKQVGFVFAAPALALVVMMIIGERRPVWLVTVIVVAPSVLWLLVVQVLERPLP